MTMLNLLFSFPEELLAVLLGIFLMLAAFGRFVLLTFLAAAVFVLASFAYDFSSPKNFERCVKSYCEKIQR